MLPAVLALLLAASCGDDDKGGGTTGPQYSAEELNAMGWVEFDAGGYADAAAYFEQSLAKDSGLHEARLGLGWSRAHIGEYAAAIAAFETLVGVAAFTADAYAGIAAAALGSDPELAISAAQDALRVNAGYSFYKRPAFDARDLLLILAEGHFALAQYAEAQARVDVLDPDNELDPEDPNYVVALALAIEALRVQEAGGLP